MNMLARNKVIFSVFIIIVISPFFISSTEAQENEDLLYLTNIVENGGVLESESLVDEDGNLHTFIVVRNGNGTRLIHMHYDEGIVNFDIIEDSAQSVKLFICYADGNKVGLVYSKTSGVGVRDFRVYEKFSSSEIDISLFTLSAEIYSWYVTFYKFLYIEGVVHGFHNQYWGGDNQFMNVTHFYGTPGGIIYSDSYFIASDSTKSVIDIVIDTSSKIWYTYELRYQEDFGIGIGELNISLGVIPIATRTFSNVVYDVPEYISKACVNPADGLICYAFTNPYRLYWGFFNGTSITEETQIMYYEDPIDLELNVDATAITALVVNLVDEDIVNFYHYTLAGSSWGIHSIQSEEKALRDQYDVSLQENNYIILFSTTIDTSPYDPEGILTYRDNTGLALFVLTDLTLEIELLIESLEVYNPVIEFFVTKWWVVLIIAIILIIIGIILGISLRRRKDEIKDFLTDTQVGEHRKFVLYFLNIGRLIRNGFSTIFTIWLSNKKRSILTLAGFIITGYLLSSAVIIAQSEESAMVKAFNRSFPLMSDGEITAGLDTSFITSNLSFTPSPTYGADAERELLDLYKGLTVDNYIDGMVSGYKTITTVYSQFSSYDNTFVGLPNDCGEFLDTMLTEGRAPINDTEIILEEGLSRLTNVGINETLTIGAWADFWLGWTGNPADENDYKINVTVVGIFERITLGQVKRVTDHLEISNDIYRIAAENAKLITTWNNFFEILSRSTKMHLRMYGYYQLKMNFDDFRISDRVLLVEEQEDIQQRVYTFSFDPSSSISAQVEDEINSIETTELKMFFETFNNYYLNNMARLLIFAIPAILLSIFMVFESSDLFSSSYEQEMEILRNRGISTSRLFWTYLIIRLAEILVASIASFGIAVGTAIPLIKIDGFITFTNTDTNLVIGSIPAIFGLITGVLFIVSVPRILILVRRKKLIEKAPRITRRKIQKVDGPTFQIPKDESLKDKQKKASGKLSDTHKEKERETSIGSIFNFITKSRLFSWRDIFFLGLGIGLFYYFFNRTFTAYGAQAVGDFTVFLFLTIAGAIFTLIGGLPFAIKILGLIQKSISALFWRYKKSRFSFSIAEIGKDIKHFENITLIFLLVVLIIVPVLVVPYSKESTLTEQAYFMNGTDVRVRNWDDNEIATLEDLDLMPEIESYTQIVEYTIYTGELQIGDYDKSRLLVINVTDFMQTFTKPSQGVTTLDWNLLYSLNESNVIISDPMKEYFHVQTGSFLEFEDQILHLYYELEVIGNFDLFPVFFREWDNSNDQHLMIISAEAFEYLDPIVTRRLKFKDEVFIRTYQQKDAETIVDNLFGIEEGLDVDTMSEVKYKLKTPLYNIFIIEMLLSLFVATGVLIFSTFTTAIKILEKRVIKHDIMKKMGINSTRIVTMSTVQTMIAAILPALVIGAGVGFAVIDITLQQLNYGAAPYQFYVNYPIIWIIVLFIGVPVLVYLSLSYFLKREFSKYSPTMME